MSTAAVNAHDENDEHDEVEHDPGDLLVPSWVAQARISPEAIGLYVRLRAVATDPICSGSEPAPFPTLAQLAERYGDAVGMLRRAISELEAIGAVTCQRTPGPRPVTRYTTHLSPPGPPA